MGDPRVSVIIPTYERSNFLKFTLDSVLNQTFHDIEVLVIDDGSKGDENHRICQQDDRIVYTKIDNSGGPARPRNIGIGQARGEFIAFVDDDDIWEPEKLAIQLKALLEHPDFGLVHGCCSLIDSQGNPMEGIIGRPGNLGDKHGDVRARMMGNWTLMMPTPLVRRSIIEQVGGFNESIPPALEDVEFWTRCSFYTKFFYLDQPLVRYRRHHSNISARKSSYIDLPLYLNEVRKNMRSEGRINMVGSRSLRLNLDQMQLRSFKQAPMHVLKNLWRLDLWWFTRSRNIKFLVKQILRV